MATVQELISRDRSSADLAPLGQNDCFTRAANDEVRILDDAAAKAQAAAAKTESLQSVVSMFSTACSALRAISARFPEASVPIAEAIKQTQLAMALVKDNPPPPVKAVAPPPPPPPLPARPVPPPTPAPPVVQPKPVVPTTTAVGK